MESDFYRPSIGVDLDAVLANLESAIARQVQVKFDEYPDDKLYKNFYMHDRYSSKQAEIKEFIKNECFDRLEFWRGLSPIKENVEELRRWWDSAIIDKCHLITGRKAKYRIDTEHFLERWYVPSTNLFMDIKDRKGMILHSLGATILIEDRYEEAVNAAKYGIKTYLLSYPYNEDFQDKPHDNIVWVKDFKEISELENFNA